MTKKKILVIEDEEDLVEALRIRLEANDYQVISAGDGASGWKIVEEERPDLVLLDLILPVIGGYEVCELIKGNKHTKNIPVIILSAKSMIKDVNRAFEAGAEDYILKPYDWEQVILKISKFI